MQDVNFPNNRSFQKLELVPKARGTQRVSNNPLSSKDISPYSHTLKVIKYFQQPNTKWNFCFRKLTTMKFTKKILSFNWHLLAYWDWRTHLNNHLNKYKQEKCPVPKYTIYTYTHIYKKDLAVTYSSRTHSLLLASWEHDPSNYKSRTMNKRENPKHPDLQNSMSPF